MGGLTDPRVTYWEPAKWIARLRATMTGGGPVLLRTNMGAGHGGASGRFDRLDEVAIAYAFALWAVGTGGQGRGLVSRVPDAVQRVAAPQSRDPPRLHVDPGSAAHRAQVRRAALHPGNEPPIALPSEIPPCAPYTKNDFPTDNVRRLLEPGPIVLVSSAHKERAQHHDHGLAHDHGIFAVAGRLLHLERQSQP